MKRVSAAVLLFAACASISTPRRDLFGVTIGMSRNDARAKLGATGTMLREERKRQEVWDLRDTRYESAIVAYDEEWKVRFITAVAKPRGERVRYSDVGDVAAAEHRTDGRNHTYVWKRDGYTIKARGADPNVLTYLTLQRAGETEHEEDE